MRKSWLLNLALLSAVVALGWWVYLKPAEETTAYSLSALQAGAVSSIRIERSGQAPMALAKKNGLWWIAAPLSAQAEPFQVERLLAILGAKASARLAAGDLARFDLDQPAVKLVIDGQTFGFGTVSTTSREQYVLTQSAVYTIELRHGAALPADVAQLVRRRLFAGDEMPVTFELADFALSSKDGKWALTPAPADLSADDINRWVDQWRQASALHVEPYDQRKPIGEIRIVFKDGRKLALGILQREPELVLVRPDENLQYTFSNETAKRLLTPPDAIAKP
ncbi:MAG: DUF4340 domain-containing protein [Pseudomonadota bacterium]